MADNDFDGVLDGNAAAGALREVFAPDVTTAQIRMRHMRLGGSGGRLALLCGADGRRSAVHELHDHRPQGGPDATWPMAGNEGRALHEICPRLRQERVRRSKSTRSAKLNRLPGKDVRLARRR